MKLIAVLMVSLCLIAPLTHATDVTYCTRKGYAVMVHGVEINPNPVIRGEEAKFSISATTEAPLTGGKLIIEVSYFGIHIHTEEHDLCEETSCPVSSGDFVISHSQVLPIFTPPGSYKLKMRLKDGDVELTCISFSFTITYGSSVADS